jgi:hypothetical protein
MMRAVSKSFVTEGGPANFHSLRDTATLNQTEREPKHPLLSPTRLPTEKPACREILVFFFFIF